MFYADFFKHKMGYFAESACRDVSCQQVSLLVAAFSLSHIGVCVNIILVPCFLVIKQLCLVIAIALNLRIVLKTFFRFSLSFVLSL